MPSPENSPDNRLKSVQQLLRDERYNGLSEAILALPNDRESSREVEVLLGDVASKVYLKCPAALIACCKKLLELEEPSRLSHATAYHMFVHRHGYDHRVCEIAIDVLSRVDQLLRFNEPYCVYENSLSEGERKMRDQEWCDAIISDIKEYFSSTEVAWPEPRDDGGLSEVLFRTRKNYSTRLSATITNFSQNELKAIYEDGGKMLSDYVETAFRYGYAHKSLDDIRSEMIFNRPFQVIADAVDSIFLDSCPPLMAIRPTNGTTP